MDLIQNYIDLINHGENPIILSALENALLPKAKKIYESVLDEFKYYFNKNIKYPMSISDILNESFKSYIFIFFNYLL